MKVKVKLLSSVRLFATPWTVAHQDSPSMNFLGKSTGVGCHFLLQGIFPTQGLNPGLPHCGQTLYCLSRQGSPHNDEGASVRVWSPEPAASTFRQGQDFVPYKRQQQNKNCPPGVTVVSALLKIESIQFLFSLFLWSAFQKKKMFNSWNADGFRRLIPLAASMLLHCISIVFFVIGLKF